MILAGSTDNGAGGAHVRRAAAFPLTLLVLGFAISATIYHDTIADGFFYDDYHFVRPYSMAELATAFHGTWDPTHIEVPFYRPLTVAFFAARFLVFGFNGPAYHWTSIALFGVLAMLVGVFLWRLTGQRHLAILATALVAVHPAMVRSLAAWVTNQMHLVEALLVFAAYVTWFSVRRAPPARWSLILVPAVAALFVKEDAVMLLISVVLVHTLYRHLVDRSLPPVPVWVLAAAFVIPAAFAWMRYEMLGGLGGYGRPALPVAIARIWRTIWSILLQLRGRQPSERIITALLAVILPAGVVIAWLRARLAGFVMLAGVAILLCFSLPFAFATKPEQVHLAALAACVIVAGAVEAIATLMPGRAARAGWWLAVACLLGLMASVSLSAVAGYAPDAPYTLYTDGIVQGWVAVPEEIRGMLASKRAGAPVPRVEDLDCISSGLGGAEQAAGGGTFRWSGERVAFFAKASQGVLVFRMHGSMIPSIGRTRVNVYVDAEGFPPRHFVLADDSWVTVRLPFRRRWYVPAGVPSIRLRVDPTFEPAKVFKSADDRTLGVQITDVRIQQGN